MHINRILNLELHNYIYIKLYMSVCVFVYMCIGVCMGGGGVCMCTHIYIEFGTMLWQILI